MIDMIESFDCWGEERGKLSTQNAISFVLRHPDKNGNPEAKTKFQVRNERVD